MSFEPLSYILGKKAAGGGGGVTVEALTVSENGTYTAPGGKAYSPVTVNVEAPVVDESKPIRFYDYDGTPLYSYTLAELQALTELPAQPVHEGLTATGWNWTLADLKAENAPVIVGGLYKTTDGVHKFYIHIENDDQRKIALVFRLQGTAEIDWGDGSAIESVTGNDSMAATSTPRIHEFSQTGDYCIGLKVTSGYIGGSYNNGSILQYAYRENLLPRTSLSANALLTRIEGGNDDVEYAWFAAFTKAVNLRSVAVPSKDWFYYNSDRTTNFTDCNTLKFVAIPQGVTETPRLPNSGFNTVSIPNSATSIRIESFNNCGALKSITIPKSVTSIEKKAFNNCGALTSISIPDSVTSIGEEAFARCYALTSVTIPKGVTSIGSMAFYDDSNIYLYDFTGWTISDLDACTFGTNIFQLLLAGTQIRFKYKSVADHAATITNLSTYASYMTYEEDDT